MPLDMSIYSRVAQPDLTNALQSIAQIPQQRAQNRLLQMQMQAAQQSQLATEKQASRQEGINSSWVIDDKGSPDFDATMRNLANKGYGDQIPAVQKLKNDYLTQQQQAGKIGIETEKAALENHMSRIKAIGQLAGSATDQASYNNALTQAKALGIDTAGMPQQYDPAIIEQLRNQALTVSEQLDNLWKQKGYEVTVSNSEETKRHNQATEDLLRNNPSVTYQTDGNGNIVALPTKAAPGAVVVGKKVTDATGAPIQGAKVVQDRTAAYKAIDKLDSTLAAYKKALEGADRLDLANPMSSKNTAIASLATQLQMDYKTAAELGAIAGPDWAIINKIIQTPTSLEGIAKGPTVLLGQIDQVAKMSARDRALLNKRFGVNQPQTPPPLPPANAQGWILHTDKNGNRAYVSPDGKQYQEVQ